MGFDALALGHIERAYVWMHERTLSMPPVFHIDIDADSAVDVKGAYIEGVDAFAIKMASGFYRNAELGLPSSSSVVLLICSKTGVCKAVFLDDGYLMNLRTALAGAVAADHLVNKDISSVGIVGTGVQARAQLRALSLVRDFQHVLVWGRDASKAASCAQDIKAFTSASVETCIDLEQLVRTSDVIVTTTQTSTPLIHADWLRAGQHITAMGSDLPGKQELDGAVLRRADLVACDSIEQCDVGGELQHVDHDGLKRVPAPLSSIICGTMPGRTAPTDITICDMTGLGVLDTAIAVAAFDKLTGD